MYESTPHLQPAYDGSNRPVSLYSVMNTSKVIGVYTAILPSTDSLPNTERLLFTRENYGEGAERLSVYSRDYHSDNWVWRVSITARGVLFDESVVIDRLVQELYGKRSDDIVFVLVE